MIEASNAFMYITRFGNSKDKSANAFAFAINQQKNLHDTYFNILSLEFPIAS